MLQLELQVALSFCFDLCSLWLAWFLARRSEAVLDLIAWAALVFGADGRIDFWDARLIVMLVGWVFVCFFLQFFLAGEVALEGLISH